MNYRPLGTTGIAVSELGLGCGKLAPGALDTDDESWRDLLAEALELGVTFFDTADIYGYGRSEERLGEAMRGRRDRVILATKFGKRPSAAARVGRGLAPIARPLRSVLAPVRSFLKRRTTTPSMFEPRYLHSALEASLRRLRTDYLDVYLLHGPPREVIERGEIFEDLERWKRAGKLRCYGVSVHEPEDVRACLEHPGVSVIQLPFNTMDTRFGAWFGELQSRGIGVVARVPLARGTLASSETRPSGSPTALRFVLDHREVSTVIPGTRRVAHLRENVRACGPLPDTEQR